MSQKATDTSRPPKASSGDSSIVTPATTPDSTTTFTDFRRDPRPSSPTMDDPAKEGAAAAGTTERQEHTEPAIPTKPDAKNDDDASPKVSPKKAKCKKPKHKRKAKASKRSSKKASADSSSNSDSEDAESDDETASDSSSEDERRKKKSAKKRSKKSKEKKRRKSKKLESDSESSASADSDSDSSDDDEDTARRKKKKAAKKAKKALDSELEDAATEAEESEDAATLEARLSGLMAQLAEKKAKESLPKSRTIRLGRVAAKPTRTKSKSKKKGDPLDYRRVDQLWDSSIHNYKLKESAEDEEGEFAEYAFLVRRRFDWENKYLSTVVDIKSKQLRAVLAEVMKECKSVSLEAEEPVIDPNLLFLYLEALRTYYKKTLKTKMAKEKKRKPIKKLEQQRALCKTLVSWIDEDYADTKKTLYPLLEAGNITFDLLWALFNPNDIAITSCYGAWDEPRCFKVDYAMKYQTMTRGEWYCIEGKYMEYDGKNFGLGDFEVDLESFKGPRKITSLATYPLRYHKDPDAVKKQIVARGEKFVNMDDMQYKFHKGLAFMKKKKQVLKISVNSRIMVDPATFRRINPNYPISLIKPKDEDDLFGDSDDDDDCSCCPDSDDENAFGGDEKLNTDFADSKNPRLKFKWVTDDKGTMHLSQVEVDENGEPVRAQPVDKMATLPDGTKKRSFTEEQLLLTSPVVLGFAFSEKLWLEFSLSGVHDITYNEDAFDSLVLAPKEKSIVRALVESHKFHAAKTIDDVIQGKGKGLVAVLHGPPGTGKTLTAEGISELLRCPLYMVSAGELGTDPARLEHELQKILDIAHSWGAVLLLDEADVFLEKRETHDIHRNALVSIFLRLLEYFQGILFLTTNRVETFDDAFQSRIHLALRYTDLDARAKITIWQTHLDRVRAAVASAYPSAATPPPQPAVSVTDAELTALARHNLNGRQIKNIVRTAQALALSEKPAEHEVATLKIEHIRRVLDVQETFERDLKGGTGYLDAMRSYT